MRLAPLSENKNRQTSFTTLHRRKGCFDGVVHPKRSILLKPNPFQKKTKRITLFQNVFKNIFSQLRTLLRKKEKSLDGILLHKKRKFSLKKAKHLFKETIRWYTRQNTLAKVSAFLSGTYLFPFASQGATYSFNQTSWAGGTSGTVASHPANETGWNKYTSSSTVTVGTDVKLPSTNYAAVDDGSSHLTSLSPVKIAAGTTTSAITISPDGTSVYAVNYSSNNISMYSRNASTGMLTPLATPTIATGAGSYGITISPDGTSVYATNRTGNTISMYSRNVSTGALTALATPTIATGSGPYGIAVSADGTSVYVSNAEGNNVSMYSRN